MSSRNPRIYTAFNTNRPQVFPAPSPSTVRYLEYRQVSHVSCVTRVSSISLSLSLSSLWGKRAVLLCPVVQHAARSSSPDSSCYRSGLLRPTTLLQHPVYSSFAHIFSHHNLIKPAPILFSHSFIHITYASHYFDPMA